MPRLVGACPCNGCRPRARDRRCACACHAQRTRSVVVSPPAAPSPDGPIPANLGRLFPRPASWAPAAVLGLAQTQMCRRVADDFVTRLHSAPRPCAQCPWRRRCTIHRPHLSRCGRGVAGRRIDDSSGYRTGAAAISISLTWSASLVRRDGDSLLESWIFARAAARVLARRAQGCWKA